MPRHITDPRTAAVPDSRAGRARTIGRRALATTVVALAALVAVALAPAASASPPGGVARATHLGPSLLPLGVVGDGSGGVVAVGSSGAPAPAASEGFAARVDRRGRLVFLTTVPAAPGASLRLAAVTPTGGGGWLIGGADGSAGTSTATVRRLTAGGGLDPTFGTGGVATVAGAPGAAVSVTALAGLPGGGALALVRQVGTTVGERDHRTTLLRLTPHGAVDPTYPPVVVGAGTVRASTLVSATDTIVVDRGVLVLAYGTGEPVIRRFLPSGAVDPTFNLTGFPHLPPPAQGADQFSPRGACRQADGGYVVGLATVQGGAPAAAFLRITAHGAVRTDWGTGGLLALPPLGASPQISNVSAVGDHRCATVVVTGSSTADLRPGLVQVLPSGRFRTDATGSVVSPVPVPPGEIGSFADPNVGGGGLLVSGRRGGAVLVDAAFEATPPGSLVGRVLEVPRR